MISAYELVGIEVQVLNEHYHWEISGIGVWNLVQNISEKNWPMQLLHIYGRAAGRPHHLSHNTILG